MKLARPIRLLLALGLSLGLMAGMLPVSFASPYGGPDCVFFPWVPNGVEIDDPVTGGTVGPFNGSITIQNLENTPTTAFVMTTDRCDTHLLGGTYSIPLEPHQARTVNVALMNLVPAGSGGGLVVTGRKTSDLNEPARIAGVQRQTSPGQGQGGTGLTGSQHEIVSGYTALSTVGIDGQVYLPIAQTNSNWNTLIRASNFDTDDNANIHITLYESGGGGMLGPFFHLTGPGETATFDLRTLGVPDGWVGSATVTGGLPIGAVAERVKVETNMLLMNVSQTSGQMSSQLYAPLIFRDWHHWNTGISLANPNGLGNLIDYTFYDMDGMIVYQDSITIPANGMEFIYLPAGDGSPFVGSARFSGTASYYGAVDEVKYLGDDGDTGHAMSYAMGSNSALVYEDQALALPVVWKPRLTAPFVHETTGIQIFNALEDPTVVEITFYDAATGDLVTTEPLSVALDGRASYTAYVWDIDELPAGFRGTAVVRNAGSGPGMAPAITAISNLVNYEVQYDGSSAFTLVRFIEP